MTKLADVLLIVDLQNGVCHEEGTIENFETITKNVNHRIEQYKNGKKLVIFVQHIDEGLVENSKAWQIVAELKTSSGDYFVNKTHANSFYQTNLQKILTKENVKSIEFCGAQTEYCMDATIKFAHGLGYQGQMIKGNTTTYDHSFMSAKETINFYENIWNKRFLTLYPKN